MVAKWGLLVCDRCLPIWIPNSQSILAFHFLLFRPFSVPPVLACRQMLFLADIPMCHHCYFVMYYYYFMNITYKTKREEGWSPWKLLRVWCNHKWIWKSRCLNSNIQILCFIFRFSSWTGWIYMQVLFPLLWLHATKAHESKLF